MGFVDELEDVVVEHAIPLPCLKEKYLNFLPSNYQYVKQVTKIRFVFSLLGTELSKHTCTEFQSKTVKLKYGAKIIGNLRFIKYIV